MKIIVCAAVAATVWTLGAAGAAAQGMCRSDDLACRVDALENRVIRLEGRIDQIISYLENGQQPSGPARQVDVPTDSSCSGDACAAIAARLCREGGFQRGVPKAFRTEYGFTRMIQITCMD